MFCNRLCNCGVTPMVDEQTNEGDTAGNQDDTTPTEPEKPTSLYDKTEAIVIRGEAVNKEARAILEEQKTLHANNRLAGTAGGGVKHMTPSEQMDKKAEEGAKEIVDAFR